MQYRATQDNHFDAVLRCLALLSAVGCFGTIAFYVTEDWTLWRCLYFTLITITTVGYGDLGVSPLGEGVAALLLLCGIGTFTYSLSTLVQIATDEEGARRRKMRRNIEDCNDHIIVCGYGRMGRAICAELNHDGVACVVIEHHDPGVQLAHEDGQLVLQGRASDDDVLRSAGVQRARGVVCAVDSDAENMFITVTARQLNNHCLVVARAETAESARKLKHAGATTTVSPHEMAGRSAASALLRPHLTRIMSGDDMEGQFELGEAAVHERSTLVGQTVQEFGCEADNVVFVAIRRVCGRIMVRPRGSDQFESGDIIIFAGSHQDAQLVQERAGYSNTVMA